jgi:hypothetical protein
MVIEMLLYNHIQIFFYSNDFKFSKGNKLNNLNYLINFLKKIFKKKKKKLESFHLNKISIRYEFSKFMFL